MNGFNFLPLVMASLGAFILSGIWYAAFSSQLSKLNKIYAKETKMPPWEIAVEILRALVVASVIALVFSKSNVAELQSALFYGLVFWLAFPVVLLLGSVIHEKVPLKLAAIHAGDWLVKLIFITSVITLWK